MSHLLVYDLAYINVPSFSVLNDSQFKDRITEGKKKANKDAASKLCPNKVIQTVNEICTDAESTIMPEITLNALDDTIEYCAANYLGSSDKAFPDDI